MKKIRYFHHNHNSEVFSFHLLLPPFFITQHESIPPFEEKLEFKEVQALL